MELPSKRYADAVAVCPAGRLDHATAEGFKAAREPHLARCPGAGDRVLDRAGVEHISSVRLRVLTLASQQAKDQGGALAVADLQPVVAPGAMRNHASPQRQRPPASPANPAGSIRTKPTGPKYPELDASS